MPHDESRPKGAAHETTGKLSGPMITVPTDCCRDMAAEIVREVFGALAAIKAAAEVLTGFAPMLDGFTFTRPEDDPDDEPRDACDEATMAAVLLDSEVDGLLDRVRRIGWLHDLDHAAGRAR